MALPAQNSTRHDSLERLRRGEISLDEYLDEQVEQALDLIRGTVADDRLTMVREVIRETVRTDPVLVELVRRTTGQVPEALTADAKH